MPNTDPYEPSDQELLEAFDSASTVDVGSRHLLATVLTQTFGLQPMAIGFGRFKLGPRLGAGAMGTVYEATDPVLECQVALKVLRRRTGDQLAIALREAQLMAGVVHDNVVYVHEVGMEDGQAWIVMELVRGSTLRRWWAESGASWRELLDVYVRCGHGIAAAHERGLVHGDFKPDNVLVSEGKRPDVVKVVDFGLARRGAVGSGIGGTPEYMAPEHYLDAVQDARSEQFSFCVALFEQLTGVHPYSRWSFEELAFTMRSQDPEVSRQVIRQRFCRELLENMSKRDLRWPQRPFRIPRRLRRALERGLAFEPARRFPSMNELLAAIDLGRTRRNRMRWMLATGLGVAAGAVATYLLVTHERVVECRSPETRVSRVWNDEARAELERIHPETAGELGLELDHYGRRWGDTYRQACERTALRGEWSAWRPVRECLERRLGAVEAVVGRLGDADRPLHMVHELLERSPAACALDTANTPSPADGSEAVVEEIEQGLASAFAAEVAQRYDEGLATMEGVVEAADVLGHGPLLAESYLQRGRLRAQQALYGDRSVEGWSVPGLDDLDLAELYAAESFARSTFIDAWIFRAKTLAVAGVPASLDDDDAGTRAELGEVLDDQRAEWLEQRGLANYNLALRDPQSDAGRRAVGRALEHYAEALTLRETTQDGVGRAKLLENTGNALVLQDDADARAEARRYYDEALGFWRAHGEGAGYLPHLYAARINATVMDDVVEARALVDEALVVLAGDPQGRLVVLLPTMLALWGKPEVGLTYADAAMSALGTALAVDALHEVQLRIFALGMLVRSDAGRERAANAARWAEALVASPGLEESLLPPTMRALAWSYVGRARVLQGALHPAREALMRAREHVPESGMDPVEGAELELALGEVLVELGDEGAARTAFVQAERWVAEVTQEYGEAEGSPVGGLRARLERHR